MILFSQQIRIIKSVFVSFKNHKLTHTAISEKELQRYKFYKYQKFETLPTGDFKLLVLNLIFTKRFSSIQSILMYLNNTNMKELKNQIPYFILNYKNVFEDEKKKVEIYEKNISIIISLYKQNVVTFLFLYYYIYNNQDQIKGRIQKRLFNDLSLFLEHIDIIKKYLEGLK
jgi:hypothetical protein